jgi:translation initiation factor 6
LSIILADIFGSPNIGVYCFSNEILAIVPNETPRKHLKRFAECLGVEVCAASIGGSRLIGVLVAANSNGMVVPHITHDHEVKKIKSTVNINVEILREKVTAFGNMVLVNDFGAVVDPRLSARTIKRLSDVFGVEAVKSEISGLPYVGALAVATNKGVLTSPSIKESEKEVIQQTLKVPVHSGTVNSGVPYIKAGLLGNSKGAVAGYLTTGAELMAMTNALSLQS